MYLPKRRFEILALLGLLPVVCPCPGADQEGRDRLTVTPHSLGAEVRARNPELRAGLWSLAEARGRLRQAGRLANPELEAAFEHDPDFREFRFGLAFSQALPLTDRLRKEKEVSLAALAAAEAEVENLVRLKIAQARAILVRYLVVEREKGARSRQLDNAEALTAYLKTIAAQGEGSPLDVGQAAVEATQLGLERRQLDARAEEWIDALKPLLCLSPASTLIVDGELPPVFVPASVEPDLLRRPDYVALLRMEALAEREIALERAKRYDDITVGIFAERAREEDAPEGLENESRVGIELSVPIPFWNKNEGAIEEKMAKRARLAASSKALANQVANEAAAARKAMAAHAEVIAEMEGTLIPLANEQLQAVEAALKEGLTDLQSVLRARDQQIDLELARVNALRDYHLARVRFETAVLP